jgi:hypothetical protein
LVSAAKPVDLQESPFAVIPHQTFEDMSNVELQAIFKKRHIVVRGVPYKKMTFDRRGLERLGSWDLPRCMQGGLLHIYNHILVLIRIRFIYRAKCSWFSL